MRPGLALNLLIDHPQYLVTFLEHLEAHFLLRICQDSMETFHFVQLLLFAPAPVPCPLELSDRLVEEGDEKLHRGELGSVGVHLSFCLCPPTLSSLHFHATTEAYLK